ncbi:hypothetical protein FJZ22_01180 [Candidatus Pacearchaeota archaeon]|nr:hypothetical protein [Candidatus Pacearchaeota archaeon]
MRFIYALLLALVCTLALYNTFTLLTIKEHSEKEIVVIERVIDGDTFKTTDGRTVRLVNINTPEKESPLSLEAISYMKKYEGTEVMIEILGTDKYHRLLARIYVGKNYLNLDLVQQGLASIFLVQEEERKKFARAEQQAVDASKGIWKKSPFFGCIALAIDEKKEAIQITCTCYADTINGWYLKDESRKTYKFKGLCRNTTLWSESAQDATDLSWGVGNVWNNDRDTAYLFTDQHELVARSSYGYLH